MKKKEIIRCKQKLVLDKKKPFIFCCIKISKHKGKHKSFMGYPKTKEIIYWEKYSIKTHK